jgi:hypothetical protein
MPGEKPTNPKDACGIRKVSFSCLSMQVALEVGYWDYPAPLIAELGLGMLEGALKYGRHNYRVIGVRASVYFDAAMRHIMQAKSGEHIDPDSGLPHITKAHTSLHVLRDAMIQGCWEDDRPPGSKARQLSDSCLVSDDPIEQAYFWLADWWESGGRESIPWPEDGYDGYQLLEAMQLLLEARRETFTSSGEGENWISKLNKKAAELLEKYPNPKPAFTQKMLDEAVKQSTQMK